MNAWSMRKCSILSPVFAMVFAVVYIIILPAPYSRGHSYPIGMNGTYSRAPSLSSAGVVTQTYDCNTFTELDEVLCPFNKSDGRKRVGDVTSHTFVTPPPTSTPTPEAVFPALAGTLAPPTVNGKAIVVDQARQRLYVYEDGIKVRSIPVSTGARMSYTPAFRGTVGHYIETMYGFGSLADHAWYLTKAVGNIYLHGAPYKLIEGQKVYEGLEFLGVRPSSHGCIRMHPEDAEWLVRWQPLGVPILVTPPDFSVFKE